jgi:hypothetical protein
MTTFLRIDREPPATDHWQAHARQWSRIGSPLRPHADDVAIMQTWLAAHVPAARPARGLLLGVTPELFHPAPHTTVAIDRERAMVDMLCAQQQGHSYGSAAIQGNWLALPFAAATFDFAFGDGSFNLLRYPDDYCALFEQLQRVLRSEAPLMLRIFTAPDRGESSIAVIEAACERRIASFHACKWRLAMSLVAAHGDANIEVAEIHREFERLAPDRAALARRTGWPRSAIDTIDAYRGSSAVYSFPRAEEWRTIAARHSVELARSQGRYELAERCPRVLCRLLP